MSTVGQLADRVVRDWLHGPNDQPVVVTLASDITSGATSATYTDSTLAADEEDLIAPGVIIEFPDGEQSRVTATDDTANTVTLIRAVNGTTAAAHTAGDEITVAPTYGRQTLLDAIYDNVVALYPSLWHITTTTVTTASTYIEVPAAVITPVAFRFVYGTAYPTGYVQFEPDFPPSSTGKAIFTDDTVPDGVTGYFTYRSKFTAPDAESDDLSTFGVDSSWERIVAVGAAAQVVGGRPLDELTAEYLTEQLQREALPPGASTDIRNGLLTLRSIWLEEAARSLRAERSQAVVYRGLNRSVFR